MRHFITFLFVAFFTAALLAQSSQLHVQDSVGVGEHVATIENMNHEGSGLKIKINGNHGMWIPFGPNNGIFPPHIPEPIDSLINPILTKINDRIMAGEGFSPPTFQDFLAIVDPNNSEVGNLIKDLGLDKLLRAGICAGQEALIDMVGLPALNVSIDLPGSIANIPNLPQMGTSTIDLPNFPNPILSFPLPSLSYDLFNALDVVDIPYNFSVTTTSQNINVPQLPDITIPAFTPFNTAVNAVNGGINTVNNELESLLLELHSIKSGIESFDAAALVKSSLGCNNVVPFQDMIMDFPIPSSDIYEKAMGLQNHFLTFVDQANRELGSVRAIHPTEWIIEQVSTANALEIASIIPGLISDDGNIIENVVNLVKLGSAWVKGFNAIGVAYKSGFGDYAEWLPRMVYDEDITYGDVVGIQGGKISKTDIAGAEQIMVISKAPIVMGNAPSPDSIHLGNNVAFIGQVPVKVIGSVRSGDYLLADLARPGYARAVAEQDMRPSDFRFVVGKSWETNGNPGFKFVQTIVGMHQNAWAGPIQKMQQRILDLEQNHKTYEEQLTDIAQKLESIDQLISSHRQ